MGGLLHLVQRGAAWAGCGRAQSPPRFSKCNSPPIDGQCTHYDGPLLCGLNVAIKRLILQLRDIVFPESAEIFIKKKMDMDKTYVKKTQQQYHNKSSPMESTRTKEKRQAQAHMEEGSKR